MKVLVLIKHKASACNKTLCEYLERNIKTIKKFVDLKVILIYDKDVSRIPKNMRTPILIPETGRPVTGIQKIKEYFKKSAAKKTAAHVPIQSNALEDFWHQEITSTGQESDGKDTKQKSAEVSQRAMERAVALKATQDRHQGKHQGGDVPSRTAAVESPGQVKSIADMEDDPMMKMYWQNLEESGG
jgi:hypothetical protein